MNEFAIISIDDSRREKKDWIRTACHWKEVDISFVNGKDTVELKKAKAKWDSVAIPGPFKAGEFGIFYSVLNCLAYGAENNGILYFEDDAIPTDNFQERLDLYLEALPKKADLFACWSPANQTYDYTNVIGYNNVGEPRYGEPRPSIFEIDHAEVSRLWQGYGNVAMYFTKKGCQRALKYIEQRGFFSPIDCLLCIATHGGYLNGYSLKPNTSPLINYDWNAETTIHKSRWGNIDELIKENDD